MPHKLTKYINPTNALMGTSFVRYFSHLQTKVYQGKKKNNGRQTKLLTKTGTEEEQPWKMGILWFVNFEWKVHWAPASSYLNPAFFNICYLPNMESGRIKYWFSVTLFC